MNFKNKKKEKLTYSGVGVDYEAMDPFKRMAQLAGRETANNIERFGFTEIEMSRGESAFLIETPDSYLAHVEEGLGTKNLVAEAMRRLTGKSYYGHIAQDTVAMIVNDLITLGALPVSVTMHLAVGSSDWFKDKMRCESLVKGWKEACNLAGCVWAGGETSTLKGIISPETAVINGSAIGVIRPKSRLIKTNIQEGDRIVLLESSGIHANGLTLARKIAESLPNGFLTKLSDGRTYGETLLDPTIIYVPFIEDCLNAKIDIHYAINITGHGWRKLMRATEPFVYIIEKIPEPQPIFEFIQRQGPVDDKEAYATFNMGAGFALYIPAKEVSQVINIAKRNNIAALDAGTIIKEGKNKKVIIQPKKIEYSKKTLHIR